MLNFIIQIKENKISKWKQALILKVRVLKSSHMRPVTFPRIDQSALSSSGLFLPCVWRTESVVFSARSEPSPPLDCLLQRDMATDGRGNQGWTSPGNFTSLCPNGTKWVWDGLGECAQDGRDMASIYLGLLSILCFMVSSLPQYWNSWKTGNMDSALSVWFLLLWLGGDSCNLVGSFLADQLPLQTYTAVYYVLADLLMISMYTYYKLKNRRAERRRALNVLAASCTLGLTASLTRLPGLSPELEMSPSEFRSRSLLSTADAGSITAFTTKEIIGFSIGSVSSVLYLCSRLPQMYTNFKRKSTEGVSYFLFALVILGNTTYGLSVLLKNPDQSQGERSYLVHHLPWLIGSLGTLSLDLMISVQFLIYRKAPDQNVSLHQEESTPLIRS